MESGDAASGKLTLVYFNMYGRAEPIRMAFWKAGVEYEDKRVTGDSWKEFKASPQCVYGSIPVLILEDGTCLA